MGQYVVSNHGIIWSSAQCGPLSKIASSCMICTICIVFINSWYVLRLVYDVDCVGFLQFREIRGFRGLNSRLTVIDGVDGVYGVSIRINVNDGNDVGPNRAIPLATILFYIDYDKTFDKTN